MRGRVFGAGGVVVGDVALLAVPSGAVGDVGQQRGRLLKEDVVNAVALTPDRIAAYARAAQDAGCDMLKLQPCGKDLDELDRLIEAVSPLLDEHRG